MIRATVADLSGAGSSELAELLFCEACLLEDLSKRAGGKSAGMHGHVRLAPISVAQDLVTTGLTHLDEAGAAEPVEDLTRR